MYRLPLRFTARRIVLAMAIAAWALASISQIAPSEIYGPITSDAIMLSVAPPVGPDGRRRAYTAAEWSTVFQQMSSNPVLDATLADPRIVKLGVFRDLPDPRARVLSKFHLNVAISVPQAEDQPALAIALLVVNSATNVHEIADALADAIAAKGTLDVDVLGRPTGQMLSPVGRTPWCRDWRLYAIAIIAATAILAVLALERSHRQASAAGPS